MSHKYPFLVYRCPGPHPARDGGKTYDFKQVCNESDLFAAQENGWFATYAEASGLDLPVDEVSPPNRDELEQQARELGLKFDGRTSDKKLSSMIDEALNDSEGSI